MTDDSDTPYKDESPQDATPQDAFAEMEAAIKMERERIFTQADLPNMSQLHIDTINVMENRVNISTFPENYQNQIKSAYRFVPVNIGSQNANASQKVRGAWK